MVYAREIPLATSSTSWRSAPGRGSSGCGATPTITSRSRRCRGDLGSHRGGWLRLRVSHGGLAPERDRQTHGAQPTRRSSRCPTASSGWAMRTFRVTRPAFWPTSPTTAWADGTGSSRAAAIWSDAVSPGADSSPTIRASITRGSPHTPTSTSGARSTIFDRAVGVSASRGQRRLRRHRVRPGSALRRGPTSRS